MATIVMIYGQSGTGKSTSLRNFGRDDVAIVNVSGKPLPFKNNLKVYNSNNYANIERAISAASQKSIVIDDATYLMTDAFMRNAKVNGFQKFTDIALDFYNLIKFAAALPNDKIIYFLGHSDQMDDGREHFKTIGKMLDNYVTLEGMFTVAIKTVVQDGKYYFSVHNSGADTVKTPIGMFEDNLIENDLAKVDKIIRAYYNIEDEEATATNEI